MSRKIKSFLLPYSMRGLPAGSTGVESEIRRLQELGFAVSAADLRERTAVPEDYNAAGHYRTIFSRLPDLSGVDLGTPRATHPPPIDSQDMAERLLSDIDELLTLATDLPRCSFERDWSKHLNLQQFPEVGLLKTCARLIMARAEYRSSIGDWQTALRCLLQTSRVAAHLFEPYFLAGLSSVNVYIQLLGVLQRTLSDHCDSEDFCIAALKLMADIHPVPCFRDALGFETVCVYLAFSDDDRSWIRCKENKLEQLWLWIALLSRSHRETVLVRHLHLVRTVCESPFQDPWTEAKLWSQRESAHYSGLPGYTLSAITPHMTQAPSAFALLAGARQITEILAKAAMSLHTSESIVDIVHDGANRNPYAQQPYRLALEDNSIEVSMPIGAAFTPYSARINLRRVIT